MSDAMLVSALSDVVGRRHLLTRPRATLRYRRGYRASPGAALAVVRPGTLVELWRVLAVLVRHDVAIVVQAANTGLTGGSTPAPDAKRRAIIVSTLRIDAIHVVDDGRQVVCLPGATLHQLERRLRPMGREPHSVIGSSCFGASVVGGVCNNSGGALVRRGPAFTEMAMFAHIDAAGGLHLVNRLGIDVGDEPEAMLTRLERGDFRAVPASGAASDRDYHRHVRDIHAPTPARFNADRRRLHDASGSAGRIAVFAVRLDTFAAASEGKTFYIGTNDPADLTALRRTLLASSGELPVSAEYLHREAFDIADRYGRDTFQAIRLLGTDRLPRLFALKARIDVVGERLGIADLSERLLQRVGRWLPDHLPPRLREWRQRYEHHLILKTDGAGLDATRAMLAELFPSEHGALFECTADEAAKAALHRFVTAGAAVRYLAVHARRVAGIVALDVALPRNATDWFAALPTALSGKVVATLRYGHFLCHVFHRDYLVAADADPAAVKTALLAELDQSGAEYPAEHNVGHQYRAKPVLADFYRSLDPTNRFNPGIGQTPAGAYWTDVPVHGETR